MLGYTDQSIFRTDELGSDTERLLGEALALEVRRDLYLVGRQVTGLRMFAVAL